VALFLIAGIAALYWAVVDPTKIWLAVTSSLIVACPCSLLLSATFTFGNMLRHFGKNKFYLKNSSVIESLASINTIVFDKTGTLTHSSMATVSYEGANLKNDDINTVFALTKESLHPFSRIINRDLINHYRIAKLPVKNFKETTGKGIEGWVKNKYIRLGTKQFTEYNELKTETALTGMVYLSINGISKGVFKINNQYREGIQEMVHSLSDKKFQLHVLSGDNDAEKKNLETIFGAKTKIRFRQSPQDKLDYINGLQKNDYDAVVLMLGDGLNDAGALKQSDVGIAVSENTSQFIPACDAILDSSEVNKLNKFIDYARSGKKVITWSFILSILYNIVGLSFAVQGLLSPLIAAILMPVSSITIVSFVTLATTYSAKRKGL
jgi:Cu+-exporting ATPase